MKTIMKNGCRTIATHLGIIAIALTATPIAQALDVTVNPGGNIQSALDQVGNAGGGTVYVNPGTYNISTTLKIPNYTRLKGVTTRPTINMSTTANVGMIAGKATNPNSMTCDFLSLNGGLTSEQQLAGTYGGREGIAWGGGYWKTNAYIYNVNVTRTAQGVVVGRTKNLVIQGSNIDYNGSAGNPGLHNMYISICNPVSIKYVSASYAVTGMGLKMTDAYADQTETSQVVENCNFNYNSGRGTAWYDISPVTFRYNNCKNNGQTSAQSGINMIRCGNITLTGNTATGQQLVPDVSYDIWLNSCTGVTQSGNTYVSSRGL